MFSTMLNTFLHQLKGFSQNLEEKALSGYLPVLYVWYPGLTCCRGKVLKPVVPNRFSSAAISLPVHRAGRN
jgi:hypothetical protein